MAEMIGIKASASTPQAMSMVIRDRTNSMTATTAATMAKASIRAPMVGSYPNDPAVNHGRRRDRVVTDALEAQPPIEAGHPASKGYSATEPATTDATPADEGAHR